MSKTDFLKRSKTRSVQAFILALIALCLLFASSETFADCRGCCSHHGGVVCRDGVTMCADGSSLSYKCISKGCNKCGSSSLSTSSSRSTEENSSQSQTQSQIQRCECNGKVTYADSVCPPCESVTPQFDDGDTGDNLKNNN